MKEEVFSFNLENAHVQLNDAIAMTLQALHNLAFVDHIHVFLCISVYFVCHKDKVI